MNPGLIHPVVIKVKKRDQVLDQVLNSRAREPVQRAKFKPAVEVLAQIKFDTQGRQSWKRMAISSMGDAELSSLYFVIKKMDLARLCLTLEKGDRVSEVDGEAVKLYITEVNRVAHYGRTSTLLRIDCRDLSPN